MMSIFTSNIWLWNFLNRKALLEHWTSMLPHAVRALVLQVQAPAANARHSCYICSWSAFGRSHQLPFLSLPFVASPIISLHVGFWPICALLFATIKKRKERQWVVISWLNLLQFQSPFHLLQMLLVRCQDGALHWTICILCWHMKSHHTSGPDMQWDEVPGFLQ